MTDQRTLHFEVLFCCWWCLREKVTMVLFAMLSIQRKQHEPSVVEGFKLWDEKELQVEYELHGKHQKH